LPVFSNKKVNFLVCGRVSIDDGIGLKNAAIVSAVIGMAVIIVFALAEGGGRA